MRHAALLSVALALGACVPRIDLEGAPCPCLEGYTCDLATDLCRRSVKMAPPPEPEARYVDVATRFDQSCAVLEDGRVACWGACLHSTHPLLVRGIDDATRVSMGADVCVLRRSGEVSCFQRPPQLVPCEPLSDAELVAETMPLPAPARHVVVGTRFGCAFLEDGGRACWGDDDGGTFGVATSNGFRATAVRVDDPSPPASVEHVVTNHATTCLAHGDTGRLVTCWGLEGDGGRWAEPLDVEERVLDLEFYGSTELGVVTLSKHLRVDVDERRVIDVADRGDVVQLSQGCRRHASGAVTCSPYRWPIFVGFDFFGVAADAVEDTALEHPEGAAIVDISNGPWHGAFVDDGGVLYGFGYSGREEGIVRIPVGHRVVSPGRQTVERVPLRVQPYLGRRSGAAVGHDGRLFTWGYNDRTSGLLGRRVADFSEPEPVRLDDVVPLQVVFYGGSDDTTVALRLWNGSANQVRILDGLGRVAAFEHAEQIAAAHQTLCARLRGGVRCDVAGTAIDLPALDGATDIGVDRTDRYVVGLVGGRVVCAPRSGRCPDAVVEDAVQLAVGDGVIVVRRRDGSVAYYGEESIYGASTPTEVPMPAPAVGITAHSHHFCAWDAEGRGVCWGANTRGQIDPDATERIVPGASPHALETRYGSLAVGERFTCGVRLDDATLECWGDNDACELGRCPGLVHHTPVRLAEPAPR